MTIRFRALQIWPPVTGSSRTGVRLSPKVPYDAVTKRFETETELLQASDIWIESGHDEGDRRLDGHIKTGAKPPRFPGVVVRLYAGVSYSVPGAPRKPLGALWFHCNTYDDWQDNLYAIAMTMERLRSIATFGTVPEAAIYALYVDETPQASRPGGDPGGGDAGGAKRPRAKPRPDRERTSSAKSPSAPPPWNPSKQDAARFLLREAGEDDHFRFAIQLVRDPAVAKRVFIQATKNAHPDLDGTDARMRAVSDAWAALGGA